MQRSSRIHDTNPAAGAPWLLVIVGAFGLLVAPARGEESKGEMPPAESAKSGGAASPRAALALEILPIGEESHGVEMPDFDLQGNRRGLLTAKTAVRTNKTDIEMDEMVLTMQQTPPRSDLKLQLPKAVYNVPNAMLYGSKDILVTRDDFTLTGDQLEFDTKNRHGVVRGNVRMVVFQFETGSNETQESDKKK